ncbi:MAG: SBBP repeat-containing protein, partial [Dehalococcoidia bacterium]
PTAQLLYSTFLGGATSDFGADIALDGSNNAYVVGTTDSTDFPTQNPVQGAFGGGTFDAFIAKLDTNVTGAASLLYSTYLGGGEHDQGTAIAVNATGNAYVTGLTASTDFPSVNPVQPAFRGGTNDAFVAKLDTAGSALLYSTFLGGSGNDQGGGIAVDDGNAYVVGTTSSGNFPTVNALQPANAGNDDAFVTKIDDTGQVTIIDVAIDIKPGSFPNSINLGSNGTVAVAIFSTNGFDATQVDPTTVTLASAAVRLKGKGTPMSSTKDVDGNGLLDLIVHVDTEALQLSETDQQAVLEGQTFGGELISGVDTVRIVP